MVNNLTNFYFWCASRVLTLDRQYAKEILNSIGALCQTTLPRHISQKQAALEAVAAVGLNQIAEVAMSWFGDRTEDARMFEERLEILKNYK